MKPKWKAVINAALGVVGLEKFELKDGKINLSDEQKAKVEELGPGLTQAIENHLKTETPNAEDEIPTETFDAIVAAKTKEIVDGLKAQVSEKDKTINAQKKIIETLAKEPEDDVTPKGGPEAQAPKFKPNMSLYHNRVWQAQQNGYDVPIAADSIDISDLKTEFGPYIKGEKRNLIKKLTQKTETEQFMTSVLTDDSVWRAGHASISSVIQQFVAAWTPLGQATVTPLAIEQRRHKINVPVTPAEVIGSWLGFLYDESKTPMDMPLVQFVLDLIVDQAIEDRETKLVGKGVYVEITEKPASGTTGQATGKSMDGLWTILRKEYEKGSSSNVHFVKLGELTESNIVDKMKAFRKALPEVLQSKPMNALCSRSLYGLYKDGYQTAFPNTKNADVNNDFIDFSLIKLNPVASLSGLMSFFVTPKDNLIRLRGKNDAASTFRMQEQDYDVKIFAEYSEAVGFAVAESIVAYMSVVEICDYYAKNNDADALTIAMLEDAGCTDLESGELADYKTAIAAATGVADLAALQAIVDAVNAA